MRILLADKLAAASVERLTLSHDLRSNPSLTGDTLPRALAEIKPTVVVVRSTRVSAAAMQAAPGLELIVRAGAGYDTIDVSAASERGIFVANCPGKNAVAVAELAFGLILALDRNIPDNVAQARQGRWNKARFSKAAGLRGRTLGLLGLGNIGREMVPRALAFGLSVIAWSRSFTPERAQELGILYADDPIDVARRADIVSIHLAATPETRGLVGAEFFDQMRYGAHLINTSRSAVVDEAAAVDAMATKGIRFATDVLDGEPSVKTGELSHPFVQSEGTYITHHIGASTTEASDAVGTEVERVIGTFIDSGQVPNCVNLEPTSPATHLLAVRHLDKVGVLASVLGVMRRADWNVQEMDNQIFRGAKSACAHIRFDASGAASEIDAGVAEIRHLDEVLGASVIRL